MAEATADTKTGALRDEKINVKLKLAGLWTTFMFFYAYVDILGLYKPGIIEDILAGKAFVFEITPSFILIGLVLTTIPALMIPLSLTLPARVNRWTNIVLGILLVPYTLFNLTGAGAWIHYYYGAGVEVLLLALVLWYAWKWPKAPVDSTQRAEANDRKTGQPQD